MIQEIIASVNNLSQGNQFLAGVLMASISGGAMWMIRVWPSTVWNFLKNQLTTSVTFNNAGWQQNQNFVTLMSYLNQYINETGTRSLSIDSSYDHESGRPVMILSLGAGYHFLWYKRTPLLLHRKPHDNNQGENIKEVITITKLGRSHSLFKDMVIDNTPKHEGIVVSNWSKDRWVVTSKIQCGGLDSVALDEDQRLFFTTEMDKFRNNKDIYDRLGIPHKLTMILHGMPGSGKTSLIRALASEYQMNICTLDLKCIGDKELLIAVQSIPQNTILLVEDFDSTPHLKSRTETKSDGSFSLDDLASAGSLTGVLNVFDGVASLSDVAIVLTTNHLEMIDSAMLRPGRIDHIRQIPKPGPDAIRQHFVDLYPELENDESISWGYIPGCIIHHIKYTAMNDFNLAGKLITYYVENPEVALKEQNGRISELETAKEIQRKICSLVASDCDEAPALDRVGS